MKEIRTQFDLTNHILTSLRGGKIGHYEKSVLLAISCHVNPDNEWKGWPSAETIVDIAVMSRSSVFRSLNELKEMGVIEYVKGKTNVSNKYKVVLEKLNNFTEEKACYATAKRVKKYEPDEDFENAPF